MKRLTILIVALSLCLVVVVLHHNVGKVVTQGMAGPGINTRLPEPLHGKDLLDKKLQYEQAERDSLRKAQYERQDP